MAATAAMPHRVAWVDALRALCIALVVCFHDTDIANTWGRRWHTLVRDPVRPRCTGTSPTDTRLLRAQAYWIHVPMFVALSGVMYSTARPSLRRVLRQVATRLFVP